MLNKCNCQLFEIEKHFLKTTTLIVQNAELRLPKSNESLQLILLCGGLTAASCLLTMNWKMVG